MSITSLYHHCVPGCGLGSSSCRHDKVMEGRAGKKCSPDALKLRCTTAHLSLNRLCAPSYMHIVLSLGAEKGQSIESTLTLGHQSVSEPRNWTSVWHSDAELWTKVAHSGTCSFSAVVLQQVFSLKDKKFRNHCFSQTVTPDAASPKLLPVLLCVKRNVPAWYL